MATGTTGAKGGYGLGAGRAKHGNASAANLPPKSRSSLHGKVGNAASRATVGRAPIYKPPSGGLGFSVGDIGRMNVNGFGKL